MMMQWSDDIYDALALRSQALFKNKHVLPTAVWIAWAGDNTFRTPDVVRGLGGRIESNKALEALEHLRDSELLLELPYPGRPHPRIFQRRPSSFWHAVSEFAEEAGKLPSTLPTEES
jgi:hypothetical protein